MKQLAAALNRMMGTPARKRGPTPRRSGTATLEQKVRSHERVRWLDRDADGWALNLQTGWHLQHLPGEHFRMCETLTEAMAQARAAEPCGCEQCRAEGDDA